MAFPVTLNGRTYTLTDFEGTNYVDGLPDAFEDFVTHAGDIYNSTSTTSNSIGTGSKTFTVEANKPYQAGTPLRIADAAAPSTNFLDTVVTSYSGTTLVVNSIGYGGSGTKTSWTVNIGGAKTVDGTLGLSQGGTGATDAAGARTNIDVYSKSEADTRYLNISGDTDDISFTGSLTINDDLLHLQSTNATTGNAIVRIEGGTAGYSQIHFADADDINEGRITFDHATNEMQFFNEVQNMTLTTGGDLLVGAMGTTTITGLSAGNHLLVGSGTGSEIVAYRNDNGIADDDFVGAFLFGNDDNSVTEDHFSGIWAKANGTAGSMDVLFAAGKTGYETDTPHMTLDANGILAINETDADSSYKLIARKDDNANTRPLGISNKDSTAGTNQAVSLDFGLSRNSGAFKPNAGRIEVGRLLDWTDGDTNIDAAMRFHAYNNNALTEVITMKGNKFVGIGDTDPQYDIHINRSSGPTIRLDTNNNAANATLLLTESSGTSTANGAMIRYDGTNNRLDIGCGTSWSTIRMSIDRDSGAIGMPDQPAFQVRNNTDQNNIPTTGYIDVDFQTEIFDRGGDVSSGVFTAPVSGRYHFYGNLRIDIMDRSADYYIIQIFTSNRNYYHIIDPDAFDIDPNYFSMQITALADMDAGDTARLQLNQTGGAAITDIIYSNGTYFMGHMVS